MASGPFFNRTVIVSGGAGTLGRAISHAFAKAGAHVVLVDIAKEAVEAHTAQITSEGLSAIACACSAMEGEEIVKTAMQAFGRVDAIVNAAGLMKYAPFEEQTLGDIQEVLEANLLGPISVIRAAWPTFKKQHYGRVVNMTSDSIYGMLNSSAYVMTKGALFGVNKTLALEGAEHGITVNCVAPCAYAPHHDENLNDLPAEAQAGFKALYTAESNVPMILALCHEKNTVSGEVFATGGYGVGRGVLGTVAGPKALRTMEDCYEHMGEIVGREKNIFEPTDLGQYVAFKSSFLM